MAIWVLVLYFGKYMWDSALDSCTADIITCLKRLKGEFATMALEVFIFTLCFLSIVLISVFSKKYKKLVAVFALYYLRQLLSNTESFTWANHIAANAIFAKLYFILEIFVIMYCLIAYKLYQKWGYKLIWAISLKLLILYLFIYRVTVTSCDDWHLGLNKS
jgi:hypothetical protein